MMTVEEWKRKNPPIRRKPITNADRIRAMSDEEIEKWFWWMHKEMMWYTDSRVFVHDWLRQKVTDMTMCETCKYENEDKNIGRCYYCRSVQDTTGDWCEYEEADEEINK